MEEDPDIRTHDPAELADFLRKFADGDEDDGQKLLNCAADVLETLAKSKEEPRETLRGLISKLRAEYCADVEAYALQVIDRMKDSELHFSTVVHEVLDRPVWLIDDNLSSLVPILSGIKPCNEGSREDNANFALQQDVYIKIEELLEEKAEIIQELIIGLVHDFSRHSDNVETSVGEGRICISMSHSALKDVEGAAGGGHFGLTLRDPDAVIKELEADDPDDTESADQIRYIAEILRSHSVPHEEEEE